MELYKNQNADVKLTIENEDDIPVIAQICEALGDETRLRILKELQHPPYLKSISELEKLIKIPKTTLIRHLQKLEESNIVTMLYRSSSHGTARIFGRDMRNFHVCLYNTPKPQVSDLITNTQSLGVGQFTDFTGESFGFATITNVHHFSTEDCFTSKRFNAQLVYATKGRITYYFSNKIAKYNNVEELSLSREICSEAPYFDNDYLSDITFWINDKEIATYTSLGDYGDHRGKLNPEWWPNTSTQYGKLLTLAITQNSVTINGASQASKYTLSDLNLQKGNKIIITVGNKDTAEHQGGFNIFGSSFGDYPQDICLSLKYKEKI